MFKQRVISVMKKIIFVFVILFLKRKITNFLDYIMNKFVFKKM